MMPNVSPAIMAASAFRSTRAVSTRRRNGKKPRSSRNAAFPSYREAAEVLQQAYSAPISFSKLSA